MKSIEKNIEARFRCAEGEEEEDNSARPRTIVGEPSEGVKGATGPGAWGLGHPSTGASMFQKHYFGGKIQKGVSFH